MKLVKEYITVLLYVQVKELYSEELIQNDL